MEWNNPTCSWYYKLVEPILNRAAKTISQSKLEPNEPRATKKTLRLFHDTVRCFEGDIFQRQKTVSCLQGNFRRNPFARMNSIEALRSHRNSDEKLTYRATPSLFQVFSRFQLICKSRWEIHRPLLRRTKNCESLWRLVLFSSSNLRIRRIDGPISHPFRS